MVNAMSRTKRLFNVLISLILLFGVYLFFINYDKAMNKINRFLDKISGFEVVIPKEQTKNNRKYNFKVLKETNNFEPKNIDDIKSIYYTVLNEGWDEFTFYCRSDYEGCADDVRKVADDSEYISLINNYVSPLNSYKKYNTLVTDDKEIYLSIDKVYDKNKSDYLINYFNKLIENLKINKNNITVEDIKKIHHYLINNISYDDDYTTTENESSTTAYGAITTKKAICGGYTDAFAIAMDLLNVPNFKVSSKEHIWNVIYFNNKWYHIDVTWDDDEINKNNITNFFMISTETLLKKDKSEHNFNISLYKELY